jgi:hypothetical protein
VTAGLDDLVAALIDPAECPELLADIHGTVDLERALAELDAVAGEGGLADDVLLGARIVLLAERRIVVAEPSTEGRLAASLARLGEGTVGRYVLCGLCGEAGGTSFAAVRRRAAEAGLVLSRPAPGPFGQEILVVTRPVGSPSLLLVQRGSLPSRP